MEPPVFSTTRLSSKWQVVIPEAVRYNLRLKEGTQFVVFGKDGTVVLKAIEPPVEKDFNALLKEANTQAKKVGLKKADIGRALREVRTRNKKRT